MAKKRPTCPEQAALDELLSSDFFKLLSEPVRLKIIAFLAVNEPCDVGTVAKAFPQDRSVISRHLSQLKRSGFVHSEKQARSNVYTFDGLALLKTIEGVADTVREMLIASCPEYEKELKKGK